MGEGASGVHADPAKDKGSEVERYRLIVEAVEMNVEGPALQVLRILCRPFELSVGFRGPVPAEYFNLIPAVFPMQDKQQVQQPRIKHLPLIGAEVAANP